MVELFMHPLNIYIHIPFCFSKCPYCGFFSCTNCEDNYEGYFKTLDKEIIEKSKKYKDRKIQTIYIGGGTPNLVPHRYIEEVINNIKKNFTLAQTHEICIELYPQYITEENIEAYKKAGINRASIGLQATNNNDLKQLNRRYSYEDFLEKLKILKDQGFQNIGVDLIFGYPGHTIERWRETLELISDLDIQHLSCYSLEIEEKTPYGNLYAQDRLNLPTEVENREMYHFASEYLSKKGFNQYEISNWCKDGFECKHNLNFWNYQDYIGLGAGAYSRIDNAKSHNPENIQEYIDGNRDIEVEKVGEIDIEKEKIILGLRLNTGVKYDEKIFQKGYMNRIGDNMCLNIKGRDMYNVVVEEII